MKVLQILPSLEVGGVERGVIDIVRELKKRGVESVVVSSGGELVSELRKMGVPHYELPVHKKSLRVLTLIPNLVQIIQRESVDIVHARSRVPAWIAWFVARKASVPFVTTCHGYYSLHALSRVMGWGKRVIVISRIIGRRMIDDFGVPPDRIRLIHRGVDLTQFQVCTEKITMPEPATSSNRRVKTIINVGRFSPIKGQVEFLKAVHLLRSRMKDIEVWLVGSEGKGQHKYTDLIKKTIDQLGLTNCVKLLGTRRDVPELMAKADLLVLSTLAPEAFGRVLIEAGAVGTPVLSTRVGGTLDIIDPGENGQLVAAGDIEGMAGQMLEMLKNEALSKKMAAKLREKVYREFTLEKMAEQTQEVYLDVLKEKKILIIKLGAAGDLILSVPSLRMIRERFPEAKISLLVDRKLSGMISQTPYVNDIIPLDRSRLSQISYFLKIAKRLRQEAFEISVDLQNSKWTHLLAKFSGIPERYGFRRGMFGFLLNRPDHSSGVQEAPVKNQYRILSRLGIRKFDEALELWPDTESERIMEKILGGIEPEEMRPKTVGIVVGSSRRWLTKRWPLESMIELIQKLIEECHYRVLLIGTEEDEEIVREIPAALLEKTVNLVGKTTLRDMISLVKRLDVIVTGDTAPLHVASAMKTKIVAFFGPTDPRRHMPPADHAVVLQKKLPCQPCYQGICRNREKMACLKKISVQEMFEAVERQLVPSEKLAGKL